MTKVDFDSPRFAGIVRTYTQEDVRRLQGSLVAECTLARHGAGKLWSLLHDTEHVATLGALSGGQAVQMVRAGLKACYVSGWQVAADANLAGETYSDQSLYPVNSVPNLVRRINAALQRADQIEVSEGITNPGYPLRWYVPLIADAEAGFGGPLNAFELMKSMIVAGAAGVHFEDQLASEKKCGHLGGKVLVPTGQFIRTLTAARLAADVMDVPTILLARTDANSAQLITSDIDERDRPFIDRTKDRTPEGFFHLKGGLDCAISRALSYAPYSDMIWCETSTPDLLEAKHFAQSIHDQFPGKLLAYNCSPSFNWKRKMGLLDLKNFQVELNAMGYKFQFVTLAGFHSLNHGMFDLALDYKNNGMLAYSKLQQEEFRSERHDGYTAVKHQREVGTGYFDHVASVISAGQSATLALEGSTEEEQF